MNDTDAAEKSATGSIFWSGAAAVYALMGRARRLQLVATLILMTFGAVAELVTIGAVLPLLALAADPSYFDRFPAAQRVLALFGAEPGGNLVVPAATLLVAAAIFSGIVRLALAWTSYRFVYGVGYDISMEIYRRLLRQPYELYVRQNSSVALSAVQKIYSVIVGIVSPVLLAFTSAIISICIVVFLFVIDPRTASFATLSVGALYVGISLASKKVLLANSQRISAVHTERLKVVQESWGGMRDIILEHSQPLFERKLAAHEDDMRRLWATGNFLTDAPRFIVEGIGIIVVALLAVYFSFQPGGLLAAIPVLGALAVGAQRLLPLVQQVYRGWASYSMSAHFLKDVMELMSAPVSTAVATKGGAPTLPASIAIEARDLWFSYSEDEHVLKGISLTIRAGERVAFIGKTGSGKSTLIDVLMGLLRPSRGQLLLGGVAMSDSNVTEWQGRLAHVPQAIFLSDDSIAANIAFGSSEDEIDMARVLAAAERADVRSFVEQLPEGFATTVGERGIRLSGGQRQRIGIARALYKNATVLVLDEATSALDAATEASIMDSIAGLDRELTIILIAHRLSTVEGCDTIYRLESGRIVQSGSYEEVVLSAGDLATTG
ncbi:MAG TPA: ABC transporter ATP-binding protein [Allosphingosinicella sp.]|jgi:ABC-type multidrug transport system fused ATPase/permease subunit